MPEDHPLRAIRLLVNAALDRLSPAFASIYADTGRPSIPPEKLLRALLLQALFTIRSERQLMQQITHKEIGRWRGDLDLAAGGAGRSARWAEGAAGGAQHGWQERGGVAQSVRRS